MTIVEFDQPLFHKSYDEQVALCPADNVTNNNNIRSSVSFGVVSLYNKQHGTWRGLN